MNDIDFDELDKAVNSLVAKKRSAANKAVVHEPASAVVDVSPKKLEAPEPELQLPPSEPIKDIAEHSAQSENPITAKQQLPKATIQTKQGGRLGVKAPTRPTRSGSFIDIVTPKPPIKKTLRVAAPIKPATEVIEPEPQQPQSKPEVPQKAIIVPKPAEIAWPDPLDFHDQKSDKPKAAEPVIDKSNTEQKSEPELQKDQPVEVSSPFITGAKVEKRPLGAFAEQAAQELARPTDAEAADFAREEKKVVEPDKQESAKDIPEDMQKPEKSESSATQQVLESATMTIPQQYRTAHKDADQTTRPVYDTKEYHPPLLEKTAHAAHKSGIWGTVLLVLLIVALVAVGGYFGFMYFIQNS